MRHLSLRHLSIFALLIAVAMLGSTLYAQSGTNVTGGNETELREFIARYIGGYGDDSVQIQIGSIPEEFPFVLPEGARPLATITRDGNFMGPRPVDSTPFVYVEVILSDIQSPQAMYDFYKAAAENNGWNEMNATFTPPAGFNPSSSAYGNYCTADGSANFSYDAYTSDGVTVMGSIRYQIPADEYMCVNNPYPPYEDMMTLIPFLSTPPNTTMRDNVGGPAYYGMDMISIAAAMTSELSLAELDVHYAGQLNTADWTVVTQDTGDASITSTWRFTAASGKSYQALMVISKTPVGEKEYRAIIMIEAEPAS